jgi:two-component system response regulator RegA
MSDDARMLLIDDDTAFCTVLARRLQREGIACDIAHDAASALHLLDALPPDARPRRILLDLRLGADNGLALIQALRERCPDARIVLATGYASIATAVDAMRRGAWHYLPKPFDLDSLLRSFGDAPDAALAEIAEAPPTLRRQSWEHLQRVLADCDGNVSAAARVLGVDRRTLQRRLAKRPVRERG